MEEHKEKPISKVEKIMAKIMIDSVVWILAKTENGIEWQRQID